MPFFLLISTKTFTYSSNFSYFSGLTNDAPLRSISPALLMISSLSPIRITFAMPSANTLPAASIVLMSDVSGNTIVFLFCFALSFNCSINFMVYVPLWNNETYRISVTHYPTILNTITQKNCLFIRTIRDYSQKIYYKIPIAFFI